MIFSTQMMDQAFRQLSASFYKILSVNFREDKFIPIKVNEDEWNSLKDKSVDFSDWLTNFCETDCHPDDIKHFAHLMDVGSDETGESMIFDNTHIYYRRMYEGEYHYTDMNIIAGEDGWYFMFIKIGGRCDE